MQKIILLNHEGFVLGLYRHKDGVNANFNPKRRGSKAVKPDQRKYVISGEHYIEGCENFRWNFKRKTWDMPDMTYHLCRPDGTIVREIPWYTGHKPRVKEGYHLVTEGPSADLYAPRLNVSGEGELYIGAGKFAIVDDKGALVNTVRAYAASDIRLKDKQEIMPWDEYMMARKKKGKK